MRSSKLCSYVGIVAQSRQSGIRVHGSGFRVQGFRFQV